jgi:hypothetical protein
MRAQVLAPFHPIPKRLAPFDFWSGPFWVLGSELKPFNWWMVEPWRALCRHSLAGDFEGPVRKPAPLSNRIPLGGVVRFGPPQSAASFILEAAVAPETAGMSYPCRSVLSVFDPEFVLVSFFDQTQFRSLT